MRLIYCLSMLISMAALCSCGTQSAISDGGQNSKIETVRASKDVRFSDWPRTEDGGQKELSEPEIDAIEKTRDQSFEKAETMLSVDRAACEDHKGHECGFISGFSDPFCAHGADDPCEVAKQLSDRINENRYNFAQARKKNESEQSYNELEKNRQREEADWKTKQLKDAAFTKSPEGITKHACDVVDAIRMGDQMIAHEKAVGAETGLVNKQTLYQAGQIKVHEKNELERIKADFKKQFGKPLNLSGCKSHNAD